MTISFLLPLPTNAWPEEDKTGTVLDSFLHYRRVWTLKKSLARTEVLQQISEFTDYKLDTSKNIPHAVSRPSSLLGFSLIGLYVHIHTHNYIWIILSPPQTHLQNSPLKVSVTLAEDDPY